MGMVRATRKPTALSTFAGGHSLRTGNGGWSAGC